MRTLKHWCLALTIAAAAAAGCIYTPDPIVNDDGTLNGEECGDIHCAPGLACCNESCGICAPIGGYCTPQQCDGEFTCADVPCGAGTHCEMVETACLNPPCELIPNCVVDEGLTPDCDNVTCGAGFHCELVQPTCPTTAPCPQIPQCVIDPGVACGDINCAPGLVCCNASCGICTPPGAFCTQQACE